MKIDLHVHSKYSKRPSIWLLNKLGCPESYLEPARIYGFLKSRGMSHVTLTDHNAIDGCLELADKPDTFISEEVTTYFPEDRCKIHVLVWNIDENIHDDIQHIRENIYDLADYLKKNNIAHAVAHPLAAVNDRFNPEHFEKLLALFQVMELNGDQEKSLNDNLVKMAARLTVEDMLELAERHGLAQDESLWPKRFVSGSDDHAGIVLGASHTRVNGAESVEEFFRSVRSGQNTNIVPGGSPRIMARNIHSITFQYIKHKFNLEKACGHDMLLRFLDNTLDPHFHPAYGLVSRIGYAFSRRRGAEPYSEDSADDEPFLLHGFLRKEGRRLIQEDPKLARMVEVGKNEIDFDGQLWFEFVNRISNRALRHLAMNVFSSLRKGMIFDIFHSLGNAGSLYLAMAPYFIAYPLFSSEREMCSEAMKKTFPELLPRKKREARVACFTDSFSDNTDASKTVAQMLACSESEDRYMKVMTCNSSRSLINNCRIFQPIGEYKVEEADDVSIFLPPFLEMLDYSCSKNFTHIHAATPGPTGLAALAIAKLLKRPLSASHIIDLPKLASEITGDITMEEAAWKYLIWFYNQCDAVRVNSYNEAKELVERGLESELIHIIPFATEQASDSDPNNSICDAAQDFSEIWNKIFEMELTKAKNADRKKQTSVSELMKKSAEKAVAI